MTLFALDDPPELRKARGAFFTPPRLVEYLAQWAIRSGSDRVLEPSCGDAEFMAGAAEQLTALGAALDDSAQLVGIEIHESSADAARSRLAALGAEATIIVGDYFAADISGKFDAVLGNPPYVRYQRFTGDARARAQRAALNAGVKLTGLASSWAAFVIHSSELLKPNGRLALVLPAELLSVNYAAQVREYLLRRFARVELVMFQERVFPSVSEEVVLLLAEGAGPSTSLHVRQGVNLEDLDSPASIRWVPDEPDDKWTPALLPEHALTLYTELSRTHFEPLQAWGETDLGMVTGNNSYFTLTASEVAMLGLSESDLLSISPPGSRHLRRLSFDEDDWESLKRSEARVYLFRPSAESPTAEALRYVANGDRRGVPTAYKCRVRDPWWRVPVVAPPDLFLTYMNHDAPRLITNDAKVGYLNSVHGVRLHDDRRHIGRDLLPLACLNSLTLVGAELVGRSYGGGILKLEPKEADRLLVPTETILQTASKPLAKVRTNVAEDLDRGDLRGAVDRVDDILLRGQLGLEDRAVAVVRNAALLLFERRVTRGSAAR